MHANIKSTQTVVTDIYDVTIVYDSYTMTMPYRLSGASLQLLAACFLSSFYGVAIPVI